MNAMTTCVRNGVGDSSELSKVHELIMVVQDEGRVPSCHHVDIDHLDGLCWDQFKIAKVEVICCLHVGSCVLMIETAPL